jgi:hypothetical protein
MLKPDDPGLSGCGEVNQPYKLSIKMHIGEWRRDEYGNRWREIMSQETYDEQE